MWMPLRRKKDAPVKGEALIRAYFPDPEPLPPEEVPDALTERLRAESDVNAERKRERLHKETYGLHQELEAQLKMQLLMQSWPPELARKYARAYARHGHESHLIPPPPEGCTVPASFAHMFETAERATALAERERAREKAHPRVRREAQIGRKTRGVKVHARVRRRGARGGDANEAFRRHTRRHARRGPGHGDAKGTGL